MIATGATDTILRDRVRIDLSPSIRPSDGRPCVGLRSAKSRPQPSALDLKSDVSFQVIRLFFEYHGD